MKKSFVAILGALALGAGLPVVQSQRADAPKAASLEVNGTYLHAFTVTYEDLKHRFFVKEEEKKLENYTLYFKQDKKNIIVVWRPNDLKPNQPGGASERGVLVQFTVRKSDFKVLDANYAQ